MSPLRIEKSFTRVLKALAELEALRTIQALPGANACAARLELRLRRYLAVSSRLASGQPRVTAESIHALMGRVKEAIAQGLGPAVISASSDLRDQLVAHHRALEGSAPGATP